MPFFVRFKPDQAHHKNTVFTVGDVVKVLEPDNTSNQTGTISRFVRGNYGKGRIYAIIDSNRPIPLGALRPIKKEEK